jgi:hypothetical protein
MTIIDDYNKLLHNRSLAIPNVKDIDLDNYGIPCKLPYNQRKINEIHDSLRLHYNQKSIKSITSNLFLFDEDLLFTNKLDNNSIATIKNKINENINNISYKQINKSNYKHRQEFTKQIELLCSYISLNIPYEILIYITEYIDISYIPTIITSIKYDNHRYDNHRYDSYRYDNYNYEYNNIMQINCKISSWLPIKINEFINNKEDMLSLALVCRYWYQTIILMNNDGSLNRLKVYNNINSIHC